MKSILVRGRLEAQLAAAPPHKGIAGYPTGREKMDFLGKQQHV
jgi:hypothetical protein